MEINTNSFNTNFLETSAKEMATVKGTEPKEEGDEREKPSKNELHKLVEELNKNPILTTKLKFGFDENDKVFYVNIIDAETDKIIKRYPDEQAISIAKKLDELQGVIFDKNA